MKKLFITAFTLALVLSAAAQKPEGSPTDKPGKAKPDTPQKVKVTPYGFVRNYYNYDSRNTYTVCGGEYNMIPYDEKWNLSESAAESLGLERTDLNAVPSAHFLALTSRIGLNLAGPTLLGALSSGKIEADFAGFSTTNNVLRIRQAWMKLAWDNGDGLTQELLAGQAWHPMSGDIMPEVLGMAAGAPFRPHSRTPQIRYTFAKGNWGFTAAALYQLQYMYNGPSASVKDNVVSWSSTNATSFANNALLPEGFLGVNYKDEHFYTQLGVDVQPIRPRNFGYVTPSGSAKPYQVPVDELNIFVSPTLYFQYTNNRFALKCRSTYANNTSHLNQLNGYAVSGVNADGSWNYAPMRASISYLNFAYGKKYRADLFFGYMKNFGAVEDLYDFGSSQYLIFMKGGDNFTHLNSVFRIAPSISYNVKSFNVGLEYEMNACTFGDLASNGSIVLDNDAFHQVIGHRVCALIKYNF